ncbi:MAG TPA: TetR/AcrR family transcriptional regulator [Kofleriaceae bacterium]|nr:TetR/AcrR family transcriptional regulator [Kofleriaceae bacterium]
MKYETEQMLGSTRIPFSPLKVPSQRRAWVTYNSVLDATARLLETTGFAALTTNHVADLAGVSIGSLYEYFPDKETLVAELARRTLREIMGEVTGGLRDAVELGGEPGLRRGVGILFEVVERRRALVRELWQLPYLATLDEFKQLPKVTVEITRQLSPAFAKKRVLRNLEASSWLLTVMVGNAVVHGAAARPRTLARKDVEDTLVQMLALLLLPARPRKGAARRLVSSQDKI